MFRPLAGLEAKEPPADHVGDRPERSRHAELERHAEAIAGGDAEEGDKTLRPNSDHFLSLTSRDAAKGWRCWRKRHEPRACEWVVPA